MPRTVDPAKHEAKRLLILDAAAECFARKGFERTTTAEICARAGISSGSLFHYFPSKRAIFVAIFELDGRLHADLLDRAGRAEDPVAGLLQVVDGLVRPLSDPSAPGLVTEVAAQAGRDPELAEVLVRNEIRLREGLAGLLRRAAGLGRIDTGLDPDRAAGWIAALVDAAFARVSVERDLEPDAEREMLRLILTRFLHIR
ncbi:TetR/AcrR family transcriptional regulator [Allokutzneria sp. A3M-2-11 16]|uniref:TetR/AcrR family transcriptional regulator n=1 Tax=Allokutzneria sp. A3M-2-11 16 TaxID=2962043 RepID=UPI0020B83BB8|nr:TetR/AcrR family transcriptional regulator [Allokutzneria sp. A3M-2-11 16]MCP3803950.1 TetR/AcrR family transcriptional regulator [Allokutzneria sp. A3M-2-11 16]